MTPQSRANWKRFNAETPRAARRATAHAMREAGKAAILYADTVEPVVPVDTGALRSSLRAWLNGRNVNQGGLLRGVNTEDFQLSVGSDISYFSSTHDNPFRSFRRPGAGPFYLSAHKSLVQAMFNRVLKEALDKELKK